VGPIDRSVADLSGTWLAAPADDALRRRFADPTFADADWAPVRVPHHWRRETAFADHDGPLLYRTRFEAPVPVTTPAGATGERTDGPANRRADGPANGRSEPWVPGSERWWLHLDGVFYQGDIWLDGAYLGDTEGYFVPHAFEVTDQLRDRREHVRAAEVACAPQRSRTAKRNLTGVFQHWDCIDPDWNPGGIWRPVTLRRTGRVRIDRLRTLCTEAGTRRAVVEFRGVFDAAAAGPVTIRTRLGGVEHRAHHQFVAGVNRTEWSMTVTGPRLWWPHALGPADLEDLEVAVLDDLGDPDPDPVSDRRRLRIGLRQVRARDWIFEINGERLHLKGANQGPARMAVGECTPEELRTDLELARDAGLDLVRLHGHIAHPDLYGQADETGMLIWQDLPLQWGYARSVRKAAARQAKEAIDLLGHHPSIIHWCAHNEPLALDLDMGEVGGVPRKAASMKVSYLAHQLLPTWNKDVLDRSIRRALESSDRSRPSTAHSGVLPGPFSLGTDTHLYCGWYHHTERDLPAILGALPRLARFLSEFGAQAIPVDAAFCDPGRWPDLDWEHLANVHGLQRTFFERVVPTAGHPSFESWAEATRAYQARLLRRHIEELRRLKYHPNGGFALFAWADARDHPCVSWSVLGHDRQAKPAYEAVADACRPVIVVADRLPGQVAEGTALELDVHVVNDLRTTLRDARVTATLSWPGCSTSWTWTGDAPADSVVRVGAVTAVVGAPEGPGEVHLDLVLDHPDAQATNRDGAPFG
jgi:beta-mannosidase